MRYADRCPCTQSVAPVELHHEVGEAVDDLCVLGEAVDGVDVAVGLEPAGNDVEPTQFPLDRAEHVEGGQLSSGDGLGDRDVTPDLSERAAPAFAVRRAVPGDVGDISPTGDPLVGQPYTGRGDLGGRDRQPELGEPPRDRFGVGAQGVAPGRGGRCRTPYRG